MSESIRLELQATGANTTGFEVPDEVVERLGGGGRPKVRVEVGEGSFRSSIARMGGSYWLGVSAARRAECGLTAREAYNLTIELDTAPRTVDVPHDLASELARHPAAKTAWKALSFSNQRRHAESITGAKNPETRSRRVAKVMEALQAP